MNKPARLIIALLSFAGAAFQPASAAVITYQEGVGGYTGTRDTNLASASSSVSFNYGNSVNYSFGRASSGTAARRILLGFDVSSLAGTYSSIDSVTLTLYSSSSGVGVSQAFSIYEVSGANANWVEGTGTGQAVEGASSWSQKLYSATTGTPWAGSAGLSTATTDYVTTPVATGVFDQAANIAYTFTLPVAVIESWITSPSTNAGLIIRANTESVTPATTSAFHSSEATTASFRPVLTINYTPVPEPSSICLALTGAACLMAGFRRGRTVAA